MVPLPTLFKGFPKDIIAVSIILLKHMNCYFIYIYDFHNDQNGACGWSPQAPGLKNLSVMMVVVVQYNSAHKEHCLVEGSVSIFPFMRDYSQEKKQNLLGNRI